MLASSSSRVLLELRPIYICHSQLKHEPKNSAASPMTFPISIVAAGGPSPLPPEANAVGEEEVRASGSCFARPERHRCATKPNRDDNDETSPPDFSSRGVSGEILLLTAQLVAACWVLVAEPRRSDDEVVFVRLATSSETKSGRECAMPRRGQR